MLRIGKAAFIGAVTAVVIVGVLVGLYEGGWWLNSRSVHHSLQIQKQYVNQQQKIVRGSYEFTTTQINQMQSDLNFIAQEDVALQSDPNNTAVISEIQSYKQTFCNTYNQVQDPSNVPANLSAAAQQYQCVAVPAA